MAEKMSYELAVLLQRAIDGDVTAFEKIWPLLFTEPFDGKRPLEDIATDLADRVTLLYPPAEKTESKVASSDETIEDLTKAMTTIVNVLFPPLPKGARRA